jgi:Sec-independent protein translocase protein TatA
MNNPTYDARVISEYLLGSLATDETERLDELSVTDDEFADSLTAAENELVDAYVQGELSGSTLQQFEAAYLRSTYRQQKVSFAQSLKLYTEQNVSLAAANAPSVSRPRGPAKAVSAGSFSKFGLLPRFVPMGLAAAALVFLVLGGWLIFDNGRLRKQIRDVQQITDDIRKRQEDAERDLEKRRQESTTGSQELVGLQQQSEGLDQRKSQNTAEPDSNNKSRSTSGEVRIASFTLMPQLRGIGEVRILHVSPKNTLIAMKLQLEPNNYSDYRVVLLDGSNRSLWRSTQLKAEKGNDNKTLSIRFPSALLSSRIHVLQVYGIDAGKSEPLSAYPFKVMR